MKWIATEEKENHTIERFDLLDGYSREMVLRYNPVQHSGRLERNNNHLLFFIEQTGIWGNKFLLENEYGVEIGRISFENLHDLDGNIHIDKKKIQFRIPLNPAGDVYFLPNKSLKQSFHCNIQVENHLTGPDKKVSAGQSEKYACFILGLFWFLFPESIPEANKSGVSISMR
ncbi:MAG TPA: hypothetical protein VHC50_01005 [Puia sp.]|jgi:hypothetical protein|nr:hypothetical protein [Puia sp.]